ncbi:MAG: c-type cytochrome biogenesis protein CcmI [Moraxellaceae bacterium]|nr:c-type cytochrome biogenesis protein CcmI [Moraxellaceae bacterium]
MTAFLLLALGLIVACLILLLPPLWRTREGSRAAEPEGLQVLREQRREQLAERDAGRIDEATYQRNLDELAQRALDEGLTDAGEAPAPTRHARPWGIAVAIALPVAALGFYLMLGNPEGLDPTKTASRSPEEMQIDAMVAQLAERVRANPQDVEAARMLGRSYMVLGRFKDAEAVFAPLAKQQPDDAQVLVDLAEAMASAQGRLHGGEPEALVERALKLDPRNPKALVLGGTLAYGRGEYRVAAERWEAMVAALPADTDASILAPVHERIAQARAQAGMPALPGKAAPAPAADGIPVAGRIELAPALAAQARPDDTLFIFIRPANGGPPLAGLKHRVSELPLSFDFSQVQRMNAGPLPERIIVGARITQSGQPRAQKGDLEGLSGEIASNTRDLKLVIDRVVE